MKREQGRLAGQPKQKMWQENQTNIASYGLSNFPYDWRSEADSPNKKLRVLDLCSGLGGFSQEFKDNGHIVITVDIESRFNPDVIADVNCLHIEGQFDIIVASPCCIEYSKRDLPKSWKCNGGMHTEPDMRLVLNCYRIIKYIGPRWWCLENVRGATGYFNTFLGKYKKKVGSRYLWGDFPDFDCPSVYRKWRISPSPERSAIRSKIPTEITRALRLACEDEF